MNFKVLLILSVLIAALAVAKPLKREKTLVELFDEADSLKVRSAAALNLAKKVKKFHEDSEIEEFLNFYEFFVYEGLNVRMNTLLKELVRGRGLDRENIEELKKIFRKHGSLEVNGRFKDHLVVLKLEKLVELSLRNVGKIIEKADMGEEINIIFKNVSLNSHLRAYFGETASVLQV